MPPTNEYLDHDHTDEAHMSRREQVQASLVAQRTASVNAIIEASGPVRNKMLLSLREVIKAQAVADPDMCSFFVQRTKSIIDLIWGDLQICIDTAIKDVETAEFGNHPALAKKGDIRPCAAAWWRARLLYSVLPFDKSIFGQAKDPVFWYFTFVSMVTTYGVRIMFCAVMLCFICWNKDPDEFQLVSYILMFKGMIFLTSGVGTSIYATLGYWKCVKPDGTHTCHIDGPAAKFDLLSAAIDMVGSCLLVWIAFGILLTGKSIHNGYKKITAEEWREAYHSGHGGHLRGLFKYDLLSVGMSFIVFCWLAWADASFEDPNLQLRANPQDFHEVLTWDLHRAFFFTKIFYGLLSAPFLVFRLPLLGSVLCHSTPTGYNRNGVCVPFLLPPMT